VERNAPLRLHADVVIVVVVVVAIDVAIDVVIVGFDNV